MLRARAVLTKLSSKLQPLLNPVLTGTSLGATNLRWNLSSAACARQYSVCKDVLGNPINYAGFPSKGTNVRQYSVFKDEYEQFLTRRNEVMNFLLNSPVRFQTINEREDRSDMPIEAFKAQSMGRYFIQHRGCQVLKSTDDLIILQQLFSYVRPATVIEIGTFTGGTAIWMGDMLRLIEMDSSIYSMDINLSFLEDRVKEIKPDNVTFLEGDSHKIEKTFHSDFLHGLPHPWVVIEDSHVNVYGILKHFHEFMEFGDYFVVEDTNPLLAKNLGAGRIYPEYEIVGNELLETLKRFLTQHCNDYKVDSFFTDLFGYNGTWNWHGYIRKM